MDNTYEGWTNRATWAVNLWVFNDEPTYRLYQGYTFDTPDDVQYFVENIIPAPILAGIIADIDGDYFSINWQELFDSAFTEED